MINIDLHYTLNQTGPVEGLLRAIPFLKSLGILIKDLKDSIPTPEKGKILMVQQGFLTPSVLEGVSSIILLERADSAISWVRPATKHQNVKRVFKIATLTPLELHNSCSGRYHTKYLMPPDNEPVKVVLEEKDLLKIKPGPSYHSYNIMEPWLQISVDYNLPRPNTNFFAGTTQYGDRHNITNHRKSCMGALKKLPGNSLVYDGKHFPRNIYNRALLESKVCVSPWGYGESAYRDFEAIYAGCVLVKPNSDFIETWPNIYKVPYYFKCNPDWSNLTEVVNGILENWDSLKEYRKEARDLLVKSWDPSVIANYLAPLLQIE